MTMASRDIANMHFFLDLKKKFPDLPDDILRSHVSLFSEDQEKCISLLQKESKNHYLSSQPFSDFRLPESKGNTRRNDNNKDMALSMPLDLCSGISHSPNFIKPESRSAPVIHSNKEPFADMYRENFVSSQNTSYHLPSKSGQTMFSTTKEHKIRPPELMADAIRGFPEQSRGHTVKLSIMPSFPFQQQQLVSDSVYAGTSHSSRQGRHTTSVNFQLQPRSADQRPFVISTIPANAAYPSNSGSHVQISVGSQGATFTALRFQHSSHPPVGDSSQAQNSYSSLFPDKSPNARTNSKNPSAQFCSAQTSQSYILAIKNEQIAQLDLILNELEKEKALCSQLRAEVSKLEKIAENNISNASSSYVEKLNELREENKQLRLECNCLYIEIDMYGSSKIPPCETEDFYSHIFTGPNGAILPCTKANNETKPKSCKSEHEDDDDEKSRWVCKKCTFANHPALEKCEMCEMSKDIDSFFDGN